MSIFSQSGHFNGKSFLGNSSAKPIAGVATRILREFGIQEALMANALIPAGSPVKLVNQTEANTNAGQKLNPNVLKIEEAKAAGDVSGFLLANQNDYTPEGEQIPRAIEGQLVDVAAFGSRIELYLPCDATVQNIPLNSKVDWDFTSNCLKKADGATSIAVQILSPVVDGVVYAKNGTSLEMKESKVVKVRL